MVNQLVSRVMIAVALVAFATMSLGQSVPPLQGRVNDYAELLDATAEDALTRQLTAIDSSTSAEVVILTIASLEGRELEPYANEIFNEWGLGKRALNNGVLILVARNDRKVRIEVGYGLEGTVTDALAGRIIRNTMAPHFKNGDYTAGIQEAVNAIEAAIKGDSQAAIEPVPTAANQPKSNDSGAFGWLVGLFIIFMLLLPFVLVGGFITLVFVLIRKANAPRHKTKAGIAMELLDEFDEDVYLTEQQQYQEEIGAVEYDVYISPDGSEVKVEEFAGSEQFLQCSKCGFEAGFIKAQRIISRGGSGRAPVRGVTLECKNCGHSVEKKVNGKPKFRPRKLSSRSTLRR